MRFIKSCLIFGLLLAIVLVGLDTQPTSVEAQGFTPRISITGAPGLDVCDSTMFQLPIDADFDAVTRSYQDFMVVSGVGLVNNFQDTFTGPLSGSTDYGFVPDPYSVPANTLITITIYTYFDDALTQLSWISEIQFDCTNGNIIYLTDGPPVTSQPAPQVGIISISTAQAQPVYESAGGGVVRDGSGNELWLPQDYDGSGADTHLVMSSTEIDGQTWYQIFIGDGASLVWVPANKVTVVE